MKNTVLKLLALCCAAATLGIASACASLETPPPATPENGTGAVTPLPPTNEPEVPPPVEEVPPQPEPEPEPEIQTKQYILIKTDGLNIRAKASTTSTVLGQVEAGMGMLLLGKEGNFYKTYYQSKIAYVSAKSEYVSTFSMPASYDAIESVIEEGGKIIGTPYVYGAVRYHNGKGVKLSGFTINKFDCSSLTQYVFYKGGNTLLQVNTRTQIFQGDYVARKDLQRGDLMFFTNESRVNKTGVERVGHVAIYLGDNLILHTASDYAKIEEISAKRWSYYIQSRRMINE